MTKNRYSSLWRWICARILALAIGSVIVIATCMWLRYAVQNYWNLGRMPVSVRQEFLALSQNPQANPARFHQIVDTWWGLSYSTPSIASADWVTVALLVLVMIPFIVVMGLRYARPLALQFSRLRDAAKDVAEGQFGRQAELIRNAPAEMVSFASDFNTMTVKLARYEKELRTSHVAMAHELRSPLTAAIGRLQGMLDGVFDASPEQLAMVMKQLQHLNRLTDELHLLSLSDAGNLVLENEPFYLDELLKERATWIMPQADAHRFTIRLHHSQACPFKAIRSVWARFLLSLWKMPSVTGVMAAILMSRCTTPMGNITSNFAMTARGYPPSSCRKCSTVLAGRSSRVPATPEAAVSVYPSLARSVRLMEAVSARRYLKPADSQSQFCYPQRRLRWKIAALDNTLTKRRIFLD